MVCISYNTNINNSLVSYSEHKAAGKVPSNFPGVLKINPENNDSVFHKEYREFGENGNEELEYFFKSLLPKIDPTRIKYKNKKDYINRSFDEVFTISDEAFGLLVLDNKLDVWNKQFEAKQNDPNAKIRGPEYKKKYVDQYQKGTSGWSEKGLAIFYKVKYQLNMLREANQESTYKYLMKFRKEAGVDGSSDQPFSSGNKRHIPENENNDEECKWSRYVKEMEKLEYEGSYKNMSFPPAVIDVDGHGPMGV